MYIEGGQISTIRICSAGPSPRGPQLSNLTSVLRSRQMAAADRVGERSEAIGLRPCQREFKKATFILPISLTDQTDLCRPLSFPHSLPVSTDVCFLPIQEG